jgi:N-acyl-D-aspartate/D-glutamate deacylase
VELARVAARYGGIYTSHIRGEGANGLKALDEAMEIGERAGLPVHVLHFKAFGKPNWGSMAALVARIQAARDRGVDITADQYPYIASMTDLHMRLPPKYLEGTSAEMVERLKHLIGEAGVNELTIGTFHAICARILRQDGRAIGVAPSFVIYDDDDTLSLVKQSTLEIGLDPKQFVPRAIASAISVPGWKVSFKSPVFWMDFDSTLSIPLM